eukprot:CAMPEP_0185728228 /NCGR_PEP_ID=MMETSP1171-20130828/3649_1 /TAXON_ID=374046 /ORGANISM="Helicotheca tamensis, Strain CCMP826" /LENGTH=243 /DNA_ID=CAMNT_0028396911 /DNA_START=11 /DNA_END=742 /DNA_ORIENTATION=-
MVCLRLPFKTKKLHRHIRNESWSMACKRCESHPKDARSWTKQNGFYEGSINTTVLPIHLACALGAPLSLFECLLAAYPESALSAESQYKRIPLHLACIYNHRLDVIELLLSRFAKGAQVCDSIGRTPLFYVMSTDPPVDMVECLLNAYPESIRTPDHMGWLPIHVACHMGCSNEAIIKLLDAYPESLYAKTKNGSRPKINDDVLSQWRNNQRHEQADDGSCAESEVGDDAVFLLPSEGSTVFA